MDGFAVARADSSAEDHAIAKTAGFDSLMIKPLTEESLRALVD
jgi:hypothetical protein